MRTPVSLFLSRAIALMRCAAFTAPLRCHRGSVALWVGLTLPGLVMTLALALETSNWSVAQISLQRAADAAALAGAINYRATTNPQIAATAAARLAQLNGVTGMTTPTWDPATSTLSDNMISSQLTQGVKSSSNTAIKVTVSRTIPASISGLFSSKPSVTISANSTAELVTVTGAGTGGQPCLLALSSSGQIVGAGSTNITMPNCTIRSNGTIGVHGGGNISSLGIYAGGAISIDPWIPAAGQHPNSGIIPDPHATNTALQTALTAAASLTGVFNHTCNNNGCSPALPNGSTCTTGSSVTCTFKPGNYGGLALSGGPFTLNFNAGLYQFKNAINFSGSTTVSGTDVTIIMAGQFTGQNTFTMTLTAPSSAAVASTGGITSIALASSSTSTATVSGNDNVQITGIVYFPNAIFDASGSSGLGTAAGSCLEIVASSIKLTGNSYFNSSCSSVNAASFSSIAGTSTTNASTVK